MSVDLRLRHDRLLREQAVELFERGFGYGLTAKRLGVPAEAVRHWQETYRAIGKDGLLAMGVMYARYDYETKVAAASAVVDGGMSKPEAMVRFGIASATPLSMQVPSRSCTRTWDGSTSTRPISERSPRTVSSRACHAKATASTTVPPNRSSGTSRTSSSAARTGRPSRASKPTSTPTSRTGTQQDAK